VSPDTWFKRVDTTARTTRSCADPLNLRLQTSRLETRRNFFSTRVVEAWNAIPSEIKNSKNVHMFKKAYRTHRVNWWEPPFKMWRWITSQRRAPQQEDDTS
jgi:hypothetical protein